MWGLQFLVLLFLSLSNSPQSQATGVPYLSLLQQSPWWAKAAKRLKPDHILTLERCFIHTTSYGKSYHLHLEYLLWVLVLPSLRSLEPLSLTLSIWQISLENLASSALTGPPYCLPSGHILTFWRSTYSVCLEILKSSMPPPPSMKERNQHCKQDCFFLFLEKTFFSLWLQDALTR